MVDFVGEGFLVVPLISNGIVAAVLVGPGGPALAGPVVVAEPQADGAEVPPAPPAEAGVADLQTPISAQPAASAPPNRGIEMLHGVIMDVTVELGRTRMSVRDLLALAPGTVLELDRAAGSPADLLVNGRLIARGEVVVVDEDFGLRVTEIVELPSRG